METKNLLEKLARDIVDKLREREVEHGERPCILCSCLGPAWVYDVDLRLAGSNGKHGVFTVTHYYPAELEVELHAFIEDVILYCSTATRDDFTIILEQIDPPKIGQPAKARYTCRE